MIHMICIDHPAAQNVPRDDKMLRLSGHWCSPRKTEKQLPSLLQGKKGLAHCDRPLVRFSNSYIHMKPILLSNLDQRKIGNCVVDSQPFPNKKKQHRKKIFHSLFLQKHSQNNWCLAVTLIDQYNINCLRKLARLKVFGNASCARQY